MFWNELPAHAHWNYFTRCGWVNVYAALNRLILSSLTWYTNIYISIIYVLFRKVPKRLSVKLAVRRQAQSPAYRAMKEATRALWRRSPRMASITCEFFVFVSFFLVISLCSLIFLSGGLSFPSIRSNIKYKDINSTFAAELMTLFSIGDVIDLLLSSSSKDYWFFNEN